MIIKSLFTAYSQLHISLAQTTLFHSMNFYSYLSYYDHINP